MDTSALPRNTAKTSTTPKEIAPAAKPGLVLYVAPHTENVANIIDVWIKYNE